MKIKILKLKVTDDQQTYDVSEFFMGNITIYQTTAHFEKEGDEYYWHLLITYEPLYTPSPEIPKVLLKEFVQEIEEYTNQNPPKSTRVRNTIKTFPETLFRVKEISDFVLLRNLGKQTCAEDSEYLEGLLSIIKKYRKD